MNWEAIGAIGEVIGALGVIFTLIYLASQIRQSNRVGTVASEAQFRTLAQNVNRIITDIPEGDPFLELLLEQDPQFSPAQRAKALMFSRSLLNLWGFTDSTFRNGLIP